MRGEKRSFSSVSGEIEREMGRGRAPCCDKSKVKRGPWSPAEDMRLVSYIQKHGHDNWRSLPKQAGLLRCGKSCRLRWINYLRPDVKRGNFTREEEDAILKLHQTLGNKWSKIASHFPGRTDNEIKNVWNTHLKKRVVAPENDQISSSSSGDNPISPSLDLSTNVNVPKQPSSSSNASIMTNDSNTIDASIKNSSPTTETQVESMFFDIVEPYGLLDEVSKPGDGLGIPLETNTNFWEMLDSLGSLQYYDNEVEGSESSIIITDLEHGNDNGGHDHAIGNRGWLSYLENELGLDEKGDEAMKRSANTQLSGDGQPAAEIFSFLDDNPNSILWPSPPHNNFD